MNIYCSVPPPAPLDGTRNDINRTVPDPGWEHVELSSYIYTCPGENYAFNYSYPDSPFRSYWFANNINNITIACTKNG